MSVVRLFSGAVFISSEFTDISFELKAELYFYFYAFGDVFRRNGTVLQTCIVSNRFELERTIPKNLKTLHHFQLDKLTFPEYFYYISGYLLLFFSAVEK